MRLYTNPYRYYCGIDLHARTMLQPPDPNDSDAAAQTMPPLPVATRPTNSKRRIPSPLRTRALDYGGHNNGFGVFAARVIGYNARMNNISLQDLAHDPAAMLNRVEAGECLVVVRDGRPVAELRPVAPSARPFGLAAGEFAAPDDFDAPFPDDILRGFEGR